MTLAQEFEARFPVSINQKVIWGDMDAYQHINNTIYFRYFENVRIEHFEKTGIIALMQETKIGPILGSTECKYLAPLTFTDSLVIGSTVTQLRDKRFTMSYEIFSNKLSQVVAKGSGEIVYFDYIANRTCAVPEEVVEAINNLENS